MDQLTDKLLGLLRQKIALYAELAAVFEQEKAYIVSSDVPALWALSARKQSLADDLGKRRAALLEALTAAGVSHGLETATFTITQFLAALPADGSRALRPLTVQLLNLKERLGALAAHNRRLIEDGLAMVADLIGVMVNADRADSGYGRPQPAGGCTKRTLFLHQEV